jgi:hypothetical protein
VERRGWGKGGEMTQTLFAHMNKIKNKKKKETFRSSGIDKVIRKKCLNHTSASPAKFAYLM